MRGCKPYRAWIQIEWGSKKFNTLEKTEYAKYIVLEK